MSDACANGCDDGHHNVADEGGGVGGDSRAALTKMAGKWTERSMDQWKETKKKKEMHPDDGSRSPPVSGQSSSNLQTR